jgi:cobalt-zinc-cadmium efflux system protein
VSRVARLSIVLALNLSLIAALIVVGVTAHSIGVLAAGGDYLADAAAIGSSLLAIWLARRPPTAKRPQGFPKATKVAALLNGCWLLIVSCFVVVGAVDRLATHTPHVDGLPVVVVSGVAAVVMLIGVFILAGDDEEAEDLNMRAVLLDTVADAAAAASVAATGGVILATGGWYWLDPAVAVVIGSVIGYHALVLVRDVVSALRAPEPRA